MAIPIPQPLRRHPVLFSFLWGTVCASSLAAILAISGTAGPIDPDSFGHIARQLYEGHGFSYATPSGFVPAYERGPIVPLVIASVMWLTGGFALWKFVVLNAILHGASTALIQRIGARVMPLSSSLLTAIIMGIHPLMLWYAVRAWSEPLLAFLVLWSIDATLRLDDTKGHLTAVELGVVLALASLTKSVMLLLPFVLVIFGPLLGMRLPVRSVAVMLLAFAMVVGIWMFHAYQERRTVTVVHTGLGFNLIQGNQIARSFPRLPLSSMPDWLEGRAHANALLTDPDSNVFEPGNDLVLVKAALRERLESPTMEIGSIAANALTFWYLAETPGKSTAAGCIQLPLLLICAFYARQLWKSHMVHRILLTVLLYLWMVHALVFAWVRHSAPVVPLLMLLSVSCVRLVTSNTGRGDLK
jgi:4-amino-4-deoxy-L-arabinose transferase-like glycosyltransferase